MGTGIARWDFSERVIVVTNAGLERGAAQAQAFADAGASVVAVEPQIDNEAFVTDLARMIEVDHGRLDALVLNDREVEDSSLLDVTVEDWQRLVRTSLTGPFLCAKHLVPIMARAGYGKIVVTTGPESSCGIPGRAHACAIHHALAGFVKDLAIEIAEDQLNANVAEAGRSVGDVDSDATLNALTRSVMWLCSDASRFVTGAIVGGGSTPHVPFDAAT